MYIRYKNKAGKTAFTNQNVTLIKYDNKYFCTSLLL